MSRRQPRAPREHIERTQRAVHTEYSKEDLRQCVEAEQERRLDQNESMLREKDQWLNEFEEGLAIRQEEEYAKRAEGYDLSRGKAIQQVEEDSEREQRALDWHGRGFPFLPSDHRAAENSGDNPRYLEERMINREYHGFYKNPS